MMASSSRLGPGEKGRLTARIDTRGRRGHLVKSIEVFSNDPEKPRTVLTLKAEVTAAERAAPRRRETSSAGEFFR